MAEDRPLGFHVLLHPLQLHYPSGYKGQFAVDSLPPPVLTSL